AHALHGDLYSLTGQTEQAIEKYKRTLELNQANYLVWEQLLINLADLKRLDELVKYSADAIDLFPNQGMLFYMNGLALVESQEYNEAIEALEQAVIMSGKNEDLKFNTYGLLGKAYRKSGKTEKAIQIYDKALLIHPDDAGILNDYSYHLALNTDRLDEAQVLLAKAIKSNPNDPEFLATQSLIHYRHQNLDKAKESIERSIKNGGDRYGYILEKYGDILFKLDQSEKALKQWKQAQIMGGASKLLERKIAEGKLIETQ
ncbi:MAG: tetratricopeptide repeat protein, partial [Saprospiraceae bacterium]|nr:tetratricopeptide repeat protein [Saprospiraceae bacterium]